MYHHLRPLGRAVPLAAVFLLGVAAGSRALAAQDDDEREAPEVKKVTFRGVENVDEGELREAIATEASRCRSLLVRLFCVFTKSSVFYERHYLDRTEFRRDVLRIRVFYWRLGYRDAQVDTTVAEGEGENNIAVTFRVVEGPPTRVSSIVIRQVGDTVVLSDREIARQMLIRAGQPMSLPALDSSAVLLRNALFEKGYADAEVRRDTVIVDTARKTAAIRLTMDPKWRTRVGRIVISGEEKVSERTIRRSLTMKEGAVYKRSDILTSQRNLYESNLFRRAAIVIPPQGDSIKLIDVTVREAPLREVRTSVGFNTIEFAQVEQRLTRYNFLGGARRLDLRGVVGNLLARQLNDAFPFHNVFSVDPELPEDERRPFLRPTWQLSADFSQPWVGSTRNSIGLGVFTHRRSLPAIVIDRGIGASASFTRQLADRSPASLTYRYEVTRVEAGDVYFCQNFGICELRTIDALRGRQRLSPLGLSFQSDRSNDLFYPTTGHLARFDAEHASAFTVSDFRYNRISAEGSKYWRVRRRGALAARVRGGWVRALASTAVATRVPREGDDTTGFDEEIIHPRKRFYAGGSQSVRGYGENQLGPRVLTIDPQELPDGALDVCTTAGDAAEEQCAAILGDVSSDKFQPRPVGGRAVIEGSVELRFPVWGKLGGAVFLDGAFVGEGALRSLTQGTGALTPGFGARYYSPAGAIRVDLGIRPRLAEELFVITEVADSTGSRLVRLNTPKVYDPLEVHGGFLGQILNRLQLHLSIGQAF